MLAEFKDFSGGITDKDIPGQTNRYKTADNLLIDGDRQLYMRDGFEIFSSTAYQLVAGERVARLTNFNGSELIAAQNKKVYYISGGAWTSLLGPASGNPFNTNTAASLVEEAQWNAHLYLASNSGDPVVKIYRDGSNNIQLRTAGLPAFERSTLPLDGGLADAITLANSIRTQMISHYDSDGASAATPNNSGTGHHTTHASLTAQYNEVNTSTAATDLASLITLMNTLRNTFREHIEDAQCADPSFTNNGVSDNRVYHVKASAATPYYLYDTTSRPAGRQPAYQWYHTLNVSLANYFPVFAIPSTATIDQLIPVLNDLRLKWNMHNYALGTHYNAWRYQGTEYYSGLGAHVTATGKVETYSWAKITPSYGAFIQYVTDVSSEYSAHLSAGVIHQTSDTVNDIPAGFVTPTNLDQALYLLGAINFFLYLHGADAVAGPSTEQYTASATAASAVLTGVSSPPADNTLKGYKCIPVVTTLKLLSNAHHTMGSQYLVTANSFAGATITCNTNFSASTAAPIAFTFVASEYHLGSGTAYDLISWNKSFNEIDFSFPTATALQALATAASTTITYLETHTLLKTDPVASLSTNLNYQVFNGNYYQNYVPTPDDPSAGADEQYVHNFYAYDGTTTYQFRTGIIFPLVAINNSSPNYVEGYFDNVPQAKSYNYKALYRYNYTVGSTSFSDFGEPSEAINIIDFAAEANTADSSEKSKFAAVALTSILSHTNASNENWAISDTTNFKKEIYRTVGNGQLYYRLDYDSTEGSITNATTTFDDYCVDEFLVLQEGLYTNGGEVANEKPPATGLIHQSEDFMYYAKDNYVYQSKAADPDSVPGDFFVKLPDPVVGISSTRSVRVGFTANYVFRIDGTYDEQGQGYMKAETIFDRTGAISSQGIVKAENAILFAGKDGIYYTDGYQCFRITDLDKTFVGYTNTAAKRSMIQATYNPLEKRAYFTVPAGGLSYPDAVWVVDLQFGIKPEGVPVTTVSGHTPTAVAVYSDILHYGDKDGYIFKQTKDLLMDLVKDTGVAATSWDKKTILWDFKSCHHDYGTGSQRKYFTKVYAQFKQQSTNLSAQVYSDADKGRSISNLPIIRSRKLSDWGDSKIDWTVAQYGASKAGEVIDEWRRFRGDGYLRSNFRAVGFKNAYCVVVASDNMGLVNIANVSANVWSATLVNASYKWPLYSVGYYLRIAGVDYPVTVRSSDTVIRVSDSGLTALSPASNLEWELWGYPKNERAHLMQYSVLYDMVGGTQKDYGGVTSLDGGEND